MKRTRVGFAALLLAGCPLDTDFVSLQAEVQTPETAVEATSSAVGYTDTESSCFRVPGVARGTGYGEHPDAALGALWTQPVVCEPSDEDCLWTPSTTLYSGNGILEDETKVEFFLGFARFDDGQASALLGEIFGTSLEAGSVAELSAHRVYDGSIDLRDPQVALFLGDYADQDIDGYIRGFSWNVVVFKWEARFLREWVYDSFDREEAYYEIDGATWVATDNTQLGYEVFACVLPLQTPPLPAPADE